ncbi:MAG: lipid-A-disaccharide synthase-related protein [Pseudomonadota bacterium]
MTLPPGTDILFVSNGHGEDAIAAAILDELAPDAGRRARIAAWPQVGHGTRYKDRGIVTVGPEHHLPSEGFGTVSLSAFIKDLRAGFIGTYLAQARFARSLRGSRALVVAIGDVVPLIAGVLSGMRTIFYSAPKSAHYGRFDGHDGLDRLAMRRCHMVLTRDALTANRLAKRGVTAEFLGNPVMDGLGATDAQRPPSQGPTTVVALLAGSRADAVENTATLLAGLAAAKRPCHGLIAAHDGFDPDVLMAHLPPGWTGGADHMSHAGGATAMILKHRFADALGAAHIAVGMAGTANEQAVGVGLPLVAVPGAGNQGPAFQRMKKRYFGEAAVSVPDDPRAIGAAITALIDDPERRARMGHAGRALMGPPGGSAAIAAAIARAAGWGQAP